jgi:RimJ/RimL family protein N-acetyltransferase
VEALIPTEVTTERLVLRRPVEADAEGLVPVFGDPEVVRYLSGEVADHDTLWRAVAEWLGHWELRGYGLWTWVERATGTVVGRGGLFYPAGWPHLEVGWTLGRAHWGRGYATEAGRAALDVAWAHLRPEWVCSVIHPENAASQQVAKRLGGRLDHRDRVRGTDVDIWRYDRPTCRPGSEI